MALSVKHGGESQKLGVPFARHEYAVFTKLIEVSTIKP